MNNSNLQVLRKHFSSLKLIARGDQLKALGPEEALEVFDKKWKELIHFLNEFNRLSESDVKNILQSNNPSLKADEALILYGESGKVIKARTANQLKMS